MAGTSRATINTTDVPEESAESELEDDLLFHAKDPISSNGY